MEYNWLQGMTTTTSGKSMWSTFYYMKITGKRSGIALGYWLAFCVQYNRVSRLSNSGIWRLHDNMDNFND